MSESHVSELEALLSTEKSCQVSPILGRCIESGLFNNLCQQVSKDPDIPLETGIEIREEPCGGPRQTGARSQDERRTFIGEVETQQRSNR